MNGKRDPRSDFLNIYDCAIRREGAEEFLEWLKSTDFFTAPASAKHHGAHVAGLVQHSVNVWRRLHNIARRDILGEKPGQLPPDIQETVAILALLHDVCKADVYHIETKRRKNPDTGFWEDTQAYTVRDAFPLGHGEKSLYLIGRYMNLSNEEALAIRWHMGAFDYSVKGGSRDLNNAIEMTPWVWRLQEADMCATHIDERED